MESSSITRDPLETHESISWLQRILESRYFEGAWFLAVAAIAASLFTFASYRIASLDQQDFSGHLRYAQALAETGYLGLPHTVYQQMVVIVRALIPFQYMNIFLPEGTSYLLARSYKISGMIVVWLFYGLLSYLLHKYFVNRLFVLKRWSSLLLSGLLTLAIMLVAPINLVTLPQHRLYLSYISPNVFHNPTIILLKPMALALFLALTGRLIDKQDRPRVAAIAALTILATMTKPNYTLVLLPVAGVWWLYRLWKRQKSQTLVFFSFLVPGVLTLVMQYLLTYSSGNSTSIILAPFQEMRFWAPHGLWYMFLLSILFPLAVILLYVKEMREGKLWLAWAAFAVGALMVYLLSETGTRQYHLNFLWGAQVTLFILFVVSAGWLAERFAHLFREKSRFSLKEYLVSGIFLLHLACGAIWYLAEVLQPLQWWL